MNGAALAADTRAAFGSSFASSVGWVATERLRGDFGSGGVEWGFRQANGRTSNAVVLTGERVVIHVATRGHGVGYLGDASDGPVFSKTRIRLTLRDLNRNVDKSVVFDSFSKPVGHADRYVLWVVGDVDDWVAGDHAADMTCGTYVLTVSDESELYRRADWTDPIEPGDGKSMPRPESSLQVVAYDWRDALSGVQLHPSRNASVISAAEFRTAPVGVGDGPEEAVFDSLTVYPSYEGDAGLSDEQKRVVVRDSALVLLSSQGPVLPSDAPCAPIVGIGMTAVATQSSTNEVPSSRPAENVPATLDRKRTFSLSGRPAATNVLDDLAAMASERGQAYLSFSDPPRVLAFPGGAQPELDDGMAWVVAGRRTYGIGLAAGGSATADIVVGDEGYEVTTEGDWVSSSSSESSVSPSSVSSSTTSFSSESSISSASECGDEWIASGFDPIVGDGSVTYDLNGTYTWQGERLGGYKVYVNGDCKMYASVYWQSWTLWVPTFLTYSSTARPSLGMCPNEGTWLSFLGHNPGVVTNGESSST